jgi:hypothetical protein
VPDRVGVVPATLLKKPLEVFYRCPFLAPDATHGSEGTPHTGVARFLVVVITMAGCGPGHGSQGALLVSLVAVFDDALGEVNCAIGWRLLVIARGCLMLAF